MFRTMLATGLILSTLAGGAAEAKDGRNAALLGGLAVGAVGGAILGSALSNHAPPPPVVEYVEPPPPRRVYVQPASLPDSFDDQAADLHAQCDGGSRHACIRFGILIGQHRERVAQWRRAHPDYFSYED